MYCQQQGKQRSSGINIRYKWPQDQVTNNKAPRLGKSSSPEDFFSMRYSYWTRQAHKMNPDSHLSEALLKQGICSQGAKPEGSLSHNLRQCDHTWIPVSQISTCMYIPGDVVQQSLLWQVWSEPEGLDFCIANNFPGTTGDANPRPTFE